MFYHGSNWLLVWYLYSWPIHTASRLSLKDILIKRGWHLPKTTIYWEFDSCSLFRLFLQGPQRGWGCEGGMRRRWALAHTLFERDKRCFARFDFDHVSNLHGSIVSFLTKTGSMTYNSNSLENLIHLYSIVWGNSQGHPTSIFGKYLFGRRFEI